jgi:hypothetical protein
LAKTHNRLADFFLEERQNATYDKDTLKRLDDMESLPKEEKLHNFYCMDLTIRDFKTKATYATK